MSLILLIFDIVILFFGEPPFAATWVVDAIFGFSGVILVSAALWWLLVFLSAGAALKIHPVVGAVLGAMTLLMWALDLLTPVGSMALALYFPNIAWGLIELFFLAVLLPVDFFILRIFSK